MVSDDEDIIPLAAGKVAAHGYSDATRMAEGELIYAGIVRSFLMAGLRHVPFGGRWVPIMNEAFAAMSDVYRIFGDLPEEADLMPTADAQPKTAAASRARLARQIGLDASDVGAAALDRLAGFFAEAQLREIFDGASLVVSAGALAAGAPVVGAGAGRFVVGRLAARLGRPYVDCADLLPAAPDLRRQAADCLPACALALILPRNAAGPSRRANSTPRSLPAPPSCRWRSEDRPFRSRSFRAAKSRGRLVSTASSSTAALARFSPAKAACCCWRSMRQ